MLGATSNLIRLYAVVPGPDGIAPRMQGVSLFRSGAIAAIIGAPSGFADSARAALWHDRIVARALRRCSAVVPFRLGIEVRSEAEVDSLLRLNVDELSHQLRRFEGRVEVSLKTRVALPTGDEPLCLPRGINRIRALAPRPVDRHERLSRGRAGTRFDGCYLISRREVNEFWRALDDIRRAVPEAPLLGSGPWAPYSFCDAPLRRSAEQTRVALESR